MKRYIRSFAVTKREVQADLRAAARVVIEHLIKIFLYPHAQETGHWKREVAAALNDVPKMKGSNKLPKAKFILDSSWMAWEDVFDRKVEVVKEDMIEHPIDADVDVLYGAIDDYFNWISNELSQFGSISFTSIYREINYLQNKYFRR